MKGRFHRVLTVVLFLLTAVTPSFPAAAQDAEPARFLIETITVEGIQRASAREIVAAESLLEEGQSYTEQELREAVYRIKRLPFVLDAEFSLRKGSERGTYELVIAVEETRPLFFLTSTQGTLRTKEERRFGLDRFSVASGATVGARHFVGARGLVFASVNKDESREPTVQLGYTRYNLFGGGGFASASVDRLVNDDFTEQTVASLTLGVPIVGNHSLRSNLSWVEQSFESPASFGTRSEQEGEVWQGSLDWVYDTTDDPLFPTEGTRVEGGVSYANGSSRFKILSVEPELSLEGRQETDQYGFSLGGRYHYRLTGRQALELGGGVNVFRTESRPPSFRSDFERVLVSTTHSASLWGFEKTDRFGDLRLETGVDLAYDHSKSTGDSGFASGNTTFGTLRSSLVFRNAWGIVRASLSYSDDLEDSL